MSIVYKKVRTVFGSANEWRTTNGTLHNINDKPAQINYDFANRKINEKWYRTNMLHREKDLPAVIHYNYNIETGEYTIKSEEWYIDGVRQL